MFDLQHKCEREYLELFANQLEIHDKNDVKDFLIPAISILINDVLNPHCDSMNPSQQEYDNAMAIIVNISIDKIPERHREFLHNKYPNSVPVCIVLYRRKCLNYHSNWHIKIDKYLDPEHPSHVGRKKIVDILTTKVNSELDYEGLFFSKYRDELISLDDFQYENNNIFSNKMAAYPESVDKMGFWSSILHVYFLYMKKFGIIKDDIVSFILFFAHQCNTTVIIVQAMIDLITKYKSRREFDTCLYTELVNRCFVYKNKEIKVDVGCGSKYQRFSSTNNKVYNKEEITKNSRILCQYFSECWKFHNSRTSKNESICMNLFLCYFDLEDKIKKNILGFGTIRTSHLIQLSALLGLIPIQLYVYMPMHMAKRSGPSNFLIQDMNWSNDSREKFLEKYTNELETLQEIFSLQLTSNILENMACIIGRKKPRKDVYYYLPWVNNVSVDGIQNMQLTFFIKVYDSRNISLLSRDSTGNVSLVQSSTNPEKNVIMLNFVKDNNDKDSLLLATSGHKIRNEWYENHYSNKVMEKQTTSQRWFLDTQQDLPKFETYYGSRETIDDYGSWNKFSMLHGTYEKFSFVLYNTSHMLKNNEIVHSSSRIEINFPSNSNYLLIWHGRLVHCGASSSYDDNYKPLKSTRFFSYLRVPEYSSNKRRKSPRLFNYTNNTKSNLVDRSSFKICDSESCNYCQDPKNIKNTRVLNLPDIETNTNQRYDGNKVVPILGSMEKYGWEIYEGINFRRNQIPKFKSEMNEIINSFPHYWEGISSTNRKIIKLSELHCVEDVKLQKLKTIHKMFDNILWKKLRKISYMEDVELDYKALISNFDTVMEQTPHRDFGSVKMKKLRS